MPTNAVIFDMSYEEAVDTVNRWVKDGATDDEKLEFVNRATDSLSGDGGQSVKQAMTDLGARAVQTDDAFYRVKTTIDDFVKNYGSDFPGIVPFQTEWNGYSANWKDYITSSRNFATVTATEYKDYELLLSTVGDITTKAEIDELAQDFTTFANNKPVDVPIDFKDKFLDLKRSVGDFQTRFNKYLEDQKAKLTTEAAKLSQDIEDLKTQIAAVDAQIKAATTALEASSWLGPLALIAATVLAVFAAQRSDLQSKLDDKKDQLKHVEAEQTELATIKAQFDGLIPDFCLLAENLGVFVDTWNTFHNEALDFATEFAKLETPSSLPAIYQGRIKLALAAAIPLEEGLQAYAASVQ